MWTKESLHDLVKSKLTDYHFIVVSNREPYIHTYAGSEIYCQVPASGVTTALDPLMRVCGGTWIAHGSGDADKKMVDNCDKVQVPPDEPKYTLKRLWLSKEEEEGFYFGFSNEAIWPLCHISYTRPVFNEYDWNTYKKVNQLFADAVVNEIGDEKAFVFIQDYQLALLSKFIKERNPNIITAQFWHIPWPNPEAFRICPWQEEILDGLLGNNLLGFHTRYHCNNFLDTIDRSLEALVDREKYEITRSGKKTKVHPFPISIDFEQISLEAQRDVVSTRVEGLKKRLGLNTHLVGIGLDRLDYTKGIPDRFKAIDRLLDKYPEYIGRVVFIQAGVPSRIHIEVYKRLNEEISSLVEKVNWKYSLGHWRPIVYLKGHVSPLTLIALRQMADFCIVSSLHDGMNLVAKEFVASRFDEDGVLILSQFAGAATELSDALMINPYAIDHFAETIRQALKMPKKERQQRMKKMRGVVQEKNVYAWAADITSELVKLGVGE
ncbi:trehalose-6-phosphate synthase [Chloroflexota bacterium]